MDERLLRTPIQVREVAYFGKPSCMEFAVKDKVIGYVLISVLVCECFVWHIYVHPKYRRKGFGRSMMRYLKGELPEFKGFNILKTEYGASTKAGVRMFRKLGFKKDGNWLKWCASETAS